MFLKLQSLFWGAFTFSHFSEFISIHCAFSVQGFLLYIPVGSMTPSQYTSLESKISREPQLSRNGYLFCAVVISGKFSALGEK